MRAVQELTKLGLTPCCGLLKASKGSIGLTFSLAALTVLLIGALTASVIQSLTWYFKGAITW